MSLPSSFRRAQGKIRSVNADTIDIIMKYGDSHMIELRTYVFIIFAVIALALSGPVRAESNELPVDNSVGSGAVDTKTEDSDSNMILIRKAAEMGDAEAQYALSSAYLIGHGGVSKDGEQAVKWLRMSADQGFPPAQYDLGLVYWEGAMVPQDFSQAVVWMQKAAVSGFVWAQYNLGIAYKVGNGVGQDFPEALKWFQEAADQGFAPAQFEVGLAYGKGQGTGRDVYAAEYWVAQAAGQGLKEAQELMEQLESIKKPDMTPDKK